MLSHTYQALPSLTEYCNLYPAIFNDDLAYLKHCIDDKKYPIEPPYDDLPSLLFYAAKHNKINSAKWLINKGANIESRSERNLTPLGVAAACGHVKMVKLLLAHDADPFVDPWPDKLAISNKHDNVLKLLPKYNSQGWLLIRLKKLTPRVTLLGICSAAAWLNVCAGLAEDLEAYDRKLTAIMKTPLFKFTETIQNQLDIEIFCKLLLLYQNYLKIPKFNSYDFKILNELKLLTLLSPMALDKRGGICLLDIVCGIYSEDEINTFFASLAAIREKFNFEHPFALYIGNGATKRSGHAIDIIYQPKTNAWWLYNINKKRKELFPESSDISEHIIEALLCGKKNSNAPLTFQTYILVTRDVKTEAQKFISAWKNTPEWQAMHAVTKEKATQHDKLDTTWLETTTEIPNADLIKTLQEKSSFLTRHKDYIIKTSVMFFLIYSAYLLFLNVLLGVSPKKLMNGLFLSPLIPCFLIALIILREKNDLSAAKKLRSLLDENEQEIENKLKSISTVTFFKKLPGERGNKIENKIPANQENNPGSRLSSGRRR